MSKRILQITFFAILLGCCSPKMIYRPDRNAVHLLYSEVFIITPSLNSDKIGQVTIHAKYRGQPVTVKGQYRKANILGEIILSVGDLKKVTDSNKNIVQILNDMSEWEIHY